MQLLGIAPSTRRTYQAGIARLSEFCTRFNLCPLPASPLTLRYFCAHLSTSVRHSTIKLYLSAIRFNHIQHEFKDPTQDVLLHYVVKGIKRTQVKNATSRLPITVQVLRALKTSLHKAAQYSYHDKRMLWAAFVVAFYGLLRVSELCAGAVSSFDPTTTLLWKDIATTSTAVRLHIKASKTDPFRKGCTITMGVTATCTCPLRAVTAYAAVRSGEPSSPAFIFEDGSPLTRQRLTANLRVLLSAAGFAPEKYASHSFRIGGATTAAAAGLPGWQIQAMGQWTSDCYTRYVRIPQSTLLQASRRLAAQGRGTQ